MSKLNKAFGGFGLAAAIATVAVTGCDPYVGANETSPQIVGVVVADTAGNGLQPAHCSTTLTDGCSADFDCPTGETCVYDTDPAPGSGATCTTQPVGVLVPPSGCIYRLPRRQGGGSFWGSGYGTASPTG